MGFVKLDCDILRSTLWFDRAAREVFVTALLLASPREFTEPTPQLAVDSLELTGWSAPPGWYGFVPASGPGIVHTAMMGLEEGMPALARLGAPEPESRSQAFDGRRMIRIDGGYLVLNYSKYRDKDHSAAERAKRYRERNAVTPSRRDVTIERRDVTYARSASSSDSEFESDPDGELEGVTAGNPRRSRFAPPDFEPNEYHRARCAELKFKVEDFLREFKVFEFNRPYSDWDKRFSLWIEKERTKAETDRANAISRAATGPRSSFRGSDVPSPPWEPPARLRAYCERHGIDFQEQLADYTRRGYTLANYPEKDLTERFQRILARVAKEKHERATPATGGPSGDRQVDGNQTPPGHGRRRDPVLGVPRGSGAPAESALSAVSGVGPLPTPNTRPPVPAKGADR